MDGACLLPATIAAGSVLAAWVAVEVLEWWTAQPKEGRNS